MDLICFETPAFYAMVDSVFERVNARISKPKEKWISGEEAMKLLRITSKATLQKLRDEGEIRFSQPMKKVILYDADSILEYLDKNSNK